MNKALWLKQVKCPLLSVSDLSTDHSTCELRSTGIKTPDSHCAWRLKVLLLGVSVTLKFSIILHPSLNQADKFYTDLHIGVVKLILWARKPNRKTTQLASTPYLAESSYQFVGKCGERKPLGKYSKLSGAKITEIVNKWNTDHLNCMRRNT